METNLPKTKTEGKRSILQFIKFALVGASNTIIDLIITFVLNAIFHWYYFAKVIGYCCGILNSYILNSSWTFKEERKKDAREIISFIAVNLVVLLISLGLMYLMSDKVWNIVGWWDALKLPSWFAKFINGERFCTLVSTLICIIINFAGNKLFVFKTKNAQDSAEN